MTFNFQFSSLYSSVDEYDFNFGEDALMLHQIYSDDDYIYTATSVGLRIFDADTDEYVSYIEYEGGFTTVAGNDDFVFLGTTGSGIKYVRKDDIIGNAGMPVILTCLNDYLLFPNVTSNDIRYLHANGDFLSSVSASGADVYKMGSQGYRSSTTFTEFGRAEKCFITSKGELYYTTSGVSGYGLDLMYATLCGWSESDYQYTDFDGNKLNDIFITEDTSSDGTHNTIFVATTGGVYVIDDGTKQVGVYSS